MWFCNRGARRHSHRAPHTCIYKHKYDIFMNTVSHVSAEIKVESNWLKSLDWANFYIYVPVYFATVLLPWWYCVVQFSITFPTKGENLDSSFIKKCTPGKKNVWFCFFGGWRLPQLSSSLWQMLVIVSSTKWVIKIPF